MPTDQPDNSDNAAPLPSGIPADVLRKAYQAFKKRLKLTRLDDESRLGRGAMTSGSDSGILAIQPPNQYPRAVWDELVRRRKLRHIGHGMYALYV